MRGLFLAALLTTLFTPLTAQRGTATNSPATPTIEFRSGNLNYLAQTRGGITVMVAPLPDRILGYSIVQVAISNGTGEPHTFRPEMFVFQRTPGERVPEGPLRALSATAVVNDVLKRANRGDLGHFIDIYEAVLFGNTKLELRFGYEQRRKDAMTMGGNSKLRAASAAAAVVLGSNRLTPGSTIDGAVFFKNQRKTLGEGELILDANGERFEFTIVPDPVPGR